MDNNFENKSVSERKNYNNRIKNLLFIFIWLYFLIKVFITDFDLLIAKSLGIQNITLFIIVRFLSFIIVLFLLWQRFGNKRFWKNLGLFFLFPIYPVLKYFVQFFILYLPNLLISAKLHFLFYSYAEFSIYFISKFKATSLKIFSFVLAFVLLYNLDSIWLIISIIIFISLQIDHLHLRYEQAFGPIRILRIKFDSITPLNKYFPIENYEKNIASGDKNVSDKERTFSQMENLLMISEFSSIISFKIKDILNNRTYLKSLFWKVVYSFAISIIFFGGINYALYKLSPSSFKVESIPVYFDFFNYSFFTIFPGGTRIIPVSKVAEIIRIIEAATGFLLSLLIITFYVNVTNSKYKDNLNNLIQYLEKYSKEAKEHFNQKYKTNPITIIEEIKKKSDKIQSLEKFVDMIFGKKNKK